MTYFISYRSVSENDTKWAAWVESVLREAFGAKTIMQMYDFKVGDNFKAKMDDALKAVAADEDGGAVVCILSKEYSQSANCQAEWTNAKQLILIKVDDYKREGLLKHGVHIDLHKLGEEAAAKKLVEQIRGVERPEGRAPFPGKDASAAEEQAQKSYSLPARNPDFSGRQKQLRELSAQLQKTACVLLEGPGGYGKTAVAVEYAYLHRSDYALIGYFNAASEAQLQDDYRGFAREYLGVQDVTLAFDEVKRAVDAYLRNQASCLLIYDNAEGYALSAFLPTGLQSGAHVLICSRLPIAGIRVGMEQEPFSIPDAKKFVKHCLPKASAEDVAELAQTLGYLPLALECAVAYIKQNAYTICGYIRDFKQYKLDVLDENPHDPGKTIRTVWRSTFAKLEQEAEKDEAAALATVLLRLCAYCAPERIPLELFIDGDTLAQNKIAGYITRYKLGSLSRDSKGSAFLSMHRLMQEAAMDSLKLDTQWLDYCLDAVKPALRFDFGTREDFDAFNRNAPHAAQIAQHAETLLTQDAQKEKVGWTYHALGYGYHKVGDYDRALAWYKKAMAICEIVLGTEHPHTATTYNNIAGIYDSKGDYDEALGWYKKALTVFEKVLGTEHPDTATTYNNLAMLYYSKGDYDWALEWYKKALAIYEKVLGTEHPDTATSYNNIALVYDRKGHYDRALGWYKKALTVFEKVLGTEHSATATTYDNIAGIYGSKGDYDEALGWYKKALIIREKVLGTEHPDTATTYNNLAMVYYSKGDYDRALEWYKKALTVFEKVLGTEHPNTAATYNNVAAVYHSKGDYDEALEWCNKALVIREKVLGTEHPDTATTYNNIAAACHSKGDFERAVEFYNKALAICEKLLGMEHPNTVATRNNIAAVYEKMGGLPPDEAS